MLDLSPAWKLSLLVFGGVFVIGAVMFVPIWNSDNNIYADPEDTIKKFEELPNQDGKESPDQEGSGVPEQ